MTNKDNFKDQGNSHFNQVYYKVRFIQPNGLLRPRFRSGLCLAQHENLEEEVDRTQKRSLKIIGLAVDHLPSLAKRREELSVIRKDAIRPSYFMLII